MNRIALTLALMIVAPLSHAQIHMTKLVIKKGESFSFNESDIVVADTLIMEDSSSIVLNRLKKENYLHTKIAVIGKNCSIQGNGIKGGPGRSGRPGASPLGPCKSGGNGTQGGRGLDGTSGVNLFLYLDKMTMKGPLKIDLRGGDGGAGGKGGDGGTGTSGTVHCKGGDGGFGGTAGQGANGGSGGSLTIKCPVNLREQVEKEIKVISTGGYLGKGGRGGYPGSAGLGPNRRNGKQGMPGAEGLDGGLGKNGIVSIVHN
ncbi:MAG TPA: hypothetical protein VFU05_14920 [Cyclobacteriaceae bacterium]|nr:hypothetical protein [Cyclobacteriaceae bacterium]